MREEIKDEEMGGNLIDDFARMWRKRFKFRLGAFHPWCLTISGSLAMLVTLVFALAALYNVVLPHYEEVAYSVQTRCQIKKITDDTLIADRLKHYTVKFPLPGIPGLRDGEATCYKTQSCSTFAVGSVVDCFFNTQDHAVRFNTAMSGHDTLKLLSYVILVVPFFFGSLCCLIVASRHWRQQWFDFADWATTTWDEFGRNFWNRNDDGPRPPPNYRSSKKEEFVSPSKQYSQQQDFVRSDQDEAMRSYQQVEAGYQVAGGGRPPAQPMAAVAGDRGARGVGGREPSPPRGGNFVQSNISWVRMQMGV